MTESNVPLTCSGARRPPPAGSCSNSRQTACWCRQRCSYDASRKLLFTSVYLCEDREQRCKQTLRPITTQATVAKAATRFGSRVKAELLCRAGKRSSPYADVSDVALELNARPAGDGSRIDAVGCGPARRALMNRRCNDALAKAWGGWTIWRTSSRKTRARCPPRRSPMPLARVGQLVDPVHLSRGDCGRHFVTTANDPSWDRVPPGSRRDRSMLRIARQSRRHMPVVGFELVPQEEATPCNQRPSSALAGGA